MEPHVSDADLVRHHAADMTPEEAAAVEAHLAGCEACRLRGEHRDPEKTVEHTPSAVDPQADAARLLRPDRVGPYKILEEIGEGGMGVVYLAEQTVPIRRRVALKIIKPGMDTKAVIARFEAERQALALMDHPNVAKVYDAGATDQGRPYFAMELVEGIPITDYCDRQVLSTRQRIELFIPVCRAVQHAHQKGIIHRDIKPSNILVGIHGETAVSKVIDFGVAKATAQRLTERTLFTEQGQLIGTPEYMSPEQAEMTALNVDTRTDVYSLGVVLYELLAGMLPFEPTRLRSMAFAEIQRIIREEEPLRPSTRLSSHGTDPSSIAMRRKTDFQTLKRQLRGELDWIAMKAIQKDRTRRYETAADLGTDLERSLQHQPVSAGPPSALYSVKKFVQRHRAFVTGAAVVMLVLISGITASTIMAVREARARTEAIRARDDLQVVVDFQSSMLGNIDAQQMGRSLFTGLRARVRTALLSEGASEEVIATTLADLDEGLRHANSTDLALEVFDEHVLHRTAAAIETDFIDQPLVRAALTETIATIYGEIGLYDAALPLQESVLRVRRRELGDEDPDTLDSIDKMGDLTKSKGDFINARIYYEEALETSRRMLGDDHPGTLARMFNTGNVLRLQGYNAEALSLWQEALARQRRVLGNDHEDTLATLNGLGVLLNEWHSPEEAEPYYREALAGRRRLLGIEDPATMSSIANMGWLYRRQGDYERAESYFREALEIRRRVLGNDHPSTMLTMDHLGGTLVIMNKLDQAEPLIREALEGRRRVLGNDHFDTLRSITSMAGLFRASGDLNRAMEYSREALRECRRALGDDHPQTVSAMVNLAGILRELGQLEEAADLGAEAVSVVRRSPLEEWRWLVGVYLAGYGRTLILLEDFTEADRALVEAHEILTSTVGDDHEQTLRAVSYLVDLYTARHTNDPKAGHDDKRAQWSARLAELEARRAR